MSMKTIKPVMEKDHMEKLYSSDNFLVSYIHNRRLNKIVEFIPKKENLRVLDAGCGEGQLLERISKNFKKNNLEIELFGSDITKVSLESAKRRINAKLFLENLEKLHYPNNYFDVITCTEVIEHIPEYKKVIEELKRCLKPNGLLILSFPNEPLWTFSRFLLGRVPIKVPDHVNSFSSKQIIRIVNLKIKKRFNIPFRLPSFIALTRIIVFQK